MSNSIFEDVMENSVKLIECLKAEVDVQGRQQLILDHLEARCVDEQHRINDFRSGLEWFNVKSPLSLENELKGKIVLLDFFTYCCINCLHVLPYLRILEEMYPVEEGVVFVGVHSAKFDNEKDAKNIMSAILRYGISHPVVNDAEGYMWKELGVPCWPTMLLVGPEGNAIFVAVGESHMTELNIVLKTAVSFFGRLEKLSKHEVPTSLEAHIAAGSPLKFPGKISCCCRRNDTNDTQHVAISDTGHHRILVGIDTGKIKHVVGGVKPGFVDGDFGKARFHSPQGVCFMESDVIYVADTENHAIRMVDLGTQKVTTVAGSKYSGNSDSSGLRSPWDICALPGGEGLLIAAAGNHQLWALFLKDTTWWRGQKYPAGACVAVAGCGREENRNNAYPHAAAFAQPSGLCVGAENAVVFVADSESSSVRRVDLADGRVSAVIGGGRSPTDLFCFGDVDGKQWDTRLQHPLGVAWRVQDGFVYVVDTYNHKVKVIQPAERLCRTLLGSGLPGDSLERGKEQFSEPGGLCISACGEHLYIADTNNNCIKVVELDTMHVSKLEVELPTAAEPASAPDAEVCVELPSSGGSVRWSVAVKLPQGEALSDGAPQRWSLELPAGWTAPHTRGMLTSEPLTLSFEVPAGPLDTPTAVLQAALFTCDNGGRCMRHTPVFALSVRCSESAPKQAESTLVHLLHPHNAPSDYLG